ncbi:MAG: ABC transporter permease [Acidobacteriia bacterium]|nr:ABC transporter permease [Terriglobia bacterium]
MLSDLLIRVRSLFRRDRVETEMDDELHFHFERQVEKYIQTGLTREEARRRARLDFGGLERVREECREARGVNLIDNLFQDVRYGFRILKKSPGFTAVAVLTLALGIGANSAIFSVVNAMLIRPLPFPQPDRLVRLWEASPSNGYHRNVVNPFNFLDWREQARSFEDMAAVMGTEVNIVGAGDPVALPGLSVSAPYFSILGVPAYLGRTFMAEDEAPGHDRNAIISYGLWRERFGGDPNILGKTVTVNAVPRLIIGVMPPGFTVPNARAQVWTPLSITRSAEWRRGRYLTVLARLKPGVSLPQAQQDIEAAAGIAAALRPDFNRNWSAEVAPLLRDVTGDLRRPLLVLLAAVGFLLLIACANVANLLLMRGTGRCREIALRQALGATRGRIVQQLLAEGLLLALAGLAAGMVFARFGLEGLLSIIPQSSPLPRSEPVTIDGGVFVFALLVSVLTVALFALIPSLRLSRVEAQSGLKQGTLQSLGSSNRMLRRALVVVEISLAILLSIGAGLMWRSFQRLTSVDPGFDPEHVVSMRIFVSPGKYDTPQKRSQYVDNLLAELRTTPGVEAAGSVHFLPLRGQISASCFAPGNSTEEPVPARSLSAQFLIINAGYLRAMGMRLVAGRDFGEQDHFGSPSVMMVNQAFVNRYLDGEDPVGKPYSVCWTVPNPARVVGVVADARQAGLEEAPVPTIYLSNSQAPMYFASLVVRARGDVRQITESAVRTVRHVDPEQAVSGVETMDSVLSNSVSQPRFQMLLLLIFAGLALGLASMGVYGVISYSVEQRTQEIGIRVALGAGRLQIAALVMKEALMLSAAGLLVGLAVALALTRLLQTLLFEVKPTDPATLLSVSALMMVVSVWASWMPVRKATRLNPTEALRYE